MSSFVICKEYYVKAAGIIAGIAHYHRDWYLYTGTRNATKEDYYNIFVEMYRMNAESVADQYGDEAPETDVEEYRGTFERFFKMGRFLFDQHKRTYTLHLSDFFRSVLYQVEREDYHAKIKDIFDQVFYQLFDLLHPHDVESWGELAIEYDPECENFISLSDLF